MFFEKKQYCVLEKYRGEIYYNGIKYVPSNKRENSVD